MTHPYFEMFQDVGHDRLAVPPPVMTKAEFEWESEKQLSAEDLREILYQEIAMHHPELADAQGTYPSTACEDVRNQMDALRRGDSVVRSSSSMPAEQTAPLFQQAQRMANSGAYQNESLLDGDDDDVAMASTPTGGAEMEGEHIGEMEDEDMDADMVAAGAYYSSRAQILAGASSGC
jgi:hypothetical protein